MGDNMQGKVLQLSLVKFRQSTYKTTVRARHVERNAYPQNVKTGLGLGLSPFFNCKDCGAAKFFSCQVLFVHCLDFILLRLQLPLNML